MDEAIQNNILESTKIAGNRLWKDFRLMGNVFSAYLGKGWGQHLAKRIVQKQIFRNLFSPGKSVTNIVVGRPRPW